VSDTLKQFAVFEPSMATAAHVFVLKKSLQTCSVQFRR